MARRAPYGRVPGGVLIHVGAVIGAVWLDRPLMRSGPDERCEWPCPGSVDLKDAGYVLENSRSWV